MSQNKISPERRSELLEEYKICNKNASEMDQLIWNSSKILGIGSLGSILISSFSLDKGNITPQQILILGFFIVASTWIWWGIAKRWWDVQHTAYQRMRDIEKVLGYGMARYISCKEGRLDADSLFFPEGEYKYIDKEKLQYSRKFKKGGVQAWMRYFPPLVTITWILFFIISKST